MKKKFLFLFFLIYSLSFSLTKAEIEKEIQKDKIETIKNVQNLAQTKQRQHIVATVFTADSILAELPKYNRPFNVGTLVLIFPSMEAINNYLPQVAKLVDRVEVYILDGEVTEDYLQDRDYEDFINKNLEEKLRAIPNIMVVKTEVEKEDLGRIVEESFLDSSKNKNSILKKYFNINQ